MENPRRIKSIELQGIYDAITAKFEDLDSTVISATTDNFGSHGIMGLNLTNRISKIKYIARSNSNPSKPILIYAAPSDRAGDGDKMQEQCRRNGISCCPVLGRIKTKYNDKEWLISFHELIENGFHIYIMNEDESFRLGREIGKMHAVSWDKEKTTGTNEKTEQCIHSMEDNLKAAKEHLDKAARKTDIAGYEFNSRASSSSLDALMYGTERFDYTNELPRGMIHGDLHLDNIVWRNKEKPFPIFIDFEYAKKACFISDIRRIYQDIRFDVISKEASPFEMANSMIALAKGYDSTRKLSLEERKIIALAIEGSFLSRSAKTHAFGKISMERLDIYGRMGEKIRMELGLQSTFNTAALARKQSIAGLAVKTV